MELTRAQSEKVEQLLEEYKNNQEKLIGFKAPTGSGKTLMISKFISEVFRNNINKEIMVIIATLSDAELPMAFLNNVENYFYKINPNSNYEIKLYNSTDNELVFKKNSILIFGTSVFGKGKNIQKNNVFKTFAENVKNLKKDRNIEIIYIRDEAHKGTDVNGRKNKISKHMIDSLIEEIYDFGIHMTATLNVNYKKIIELKHEEINEDCRNLNDKNKRVCLLKNISVKPDSNAIVNDDDAEKFEILEIAIKKFKDIQDEYSKLNVAIKPAMLIQVSSNSKTKSKNEKFKARIQKIISIIKDSTLTYLKYFSGESVDSNVKNENTLEDAARNESNIDVIIFKIGPSTGWNIPRACMLVQLRNVFSEVLNEQTLGRIKRNPLPNLEFNDVTDKYYLYSNYQESSIKNRAAYNLKEKFKSKTFYKGLIKNFEKKYDIDEYWKKVKKLISSEDNFLNAYKEEIKKTRIGWSVFSYRTEIESKSINAVNYINNKLELCIFVDRIIEKHTWLSVISKKVENFCKINIDKKYDYYLFMYLLKEKFGDTLKNEYLKAKRNYDAEEYKVIKDISPQGFYEIWIYPNTQEIDVSRIDNYGYQRFITKNSIEKKADKNIQYLDSQTESRFFYNFMNKFEELNKDKNASNEISFLAKMHNFYSDIYFEYFFEDEGIIRKSFVDFIIEVSDKNTKKVIKTYMIEVKSKNDIDQRKTESLKTAYYNYMQALKKQKNDDITLELTIALAEKNSNEVSFFDFNEKDENGQFKIYDLITFIKRVLNI